MKKLLGAAVVVVGSLILPLTGSAVLIDHFDTANVNIQDLFPADGTSVSVTENGLANVRGGSRVTTIQLTSSPAQSGKVAAIANGVSSTMDFASDPSSDGWFNLFYNGNGAGLGDLTTDLSTLVYVHFLAADASSDVRLTVRSGVTVRTATKALAGTGTLTYNYSDAAFAGINWANVNYINFQIFGAPAGDYTIDILGTDRDRGVPDTAGTMALLSIALGLLGVARMKLKE
jgi:hypothetical protein